jgi:hypothetical protein
MSASVRNGRRSTSERCPLAHSFAGQAATLPLIADIGACQWDVRFTPKSRHCGARMPCPLCAKSGHLTPRHPIDLTLSSVSAQNCDGGSRRDQKGTRCVRHCALKAAAAPATVSGEPPADLPLGNAFLGRWPETATREPGDLPPRTVTRERVGRGVLALREFGLGRVSAAGEAGPRRTKGRGDGLRFRQWGAACCLSTIAAVGHPAGVSFMFLS